MFIVVCSMNILTLTLLKLNVVFVVVVVVVKFKSHAESMMTRSSMGVRALWGLSNETPRSLYTKMFLGPQSKEDTEMIVHRLRHPIEAYSIRFHPWESEQLVCMRLELYGCDILGSPGMTS